MKTLKIEYFHSEQIGQPELYQDLASQFQDVLFEVTKVNLQESEKLLEKDIKLIPFTRLSIKLSDSGSDSFDEVLKLYGDQTHIELETLIKEYL
jgi:hypothetical protein